MTSWSSPSIARLFGLSALIAGGIGSGASSVGAVESNASLTPRARVTMVSEVSAVAPGQRFRVAMHQRLTKGWHTYWTNPGDAGQPPEAEFVLPEGASAGSLAFPAPHRIPYGPLVNFGYENEAIFIAEITPPDGIRPGETFPVEVKGSWLICEKICIPEEATFRIELPVEEYARPAFEHRGVFARGEASQPRASIWTARAEFSEKTGRLAISGDGLEPGAVREAFFFPAEWGVLDHAAPQALSIDAGRLNLELTRGQAALPAKLDGVIAIVDGAGVRSAYTLSASLDGTAANGIATAPGATSSGSGSTAGTGTGASGAMPLDGAARAVLPLWQAILWAALGGLILNLMPCVFPILAMKAMAIARLSGAGRGQVRSHALSYTVGVVVSFMALAALLIGVRMAGNAVGWGFQFTSPLFVAAMAWLMLAIGLNLSGVYNLTMTVTAGSAAASRGGHGGSFATGALAVAVATPCTAPFMAAAIGAALAMPTQNTLLVFAAMGLGMAAPYALLAVVPSLANLLPRPGAWMEHLKQALAFPMYAAAAWLIWVLAQQAGPDGVLVALGGGVLIGLAAWAYGLSQASGGRGRLVARGAAMAALFAAFALYPSLGERQIQRATAASAATDAWSAERVAALRAEGRPVFVNLTAAWCISCKVNERVAIRTDAVEAAFAKAGITLLTGDWTNGDPAITALLRANGREGVPLYLYYAKGAAEPVILPEILTESIVLRAIDSPPV